MLEHGGKLRDAAKRYNIPLKNWADLSTGINPNGWRPETISSDSWGRLPEAEDGLLEAARQYYNCESLLPVAGSQAAIQLLPSLFERKEFKKKEFGSKEFEAKEAKKNVGILNLSYAEHAHAWEKFGHHVISLTPDTIEQNLNELDILLIVNPNNPTGILFPPEKLTAWHNILKNKNGWLIVDEAFMDCTPEYSILPESQLHNPNKLNNLIVLRSIGKFFGLAGIRVGFVAAPQNILNKLNELLGPWTISGPARECATQALNDYQWQQTNQTYLASASQRLIALLSENHLTPDGSTRLFSWVKTENAKDLHESLARHGILTRLFTSTSPQTDSLRFGLPANEKQWLQLGKALNSLSDLNTLNDIEAAR